MIMWIIACIKMTNKVFDLNVMVVIWGTSNFCLVMTAAADDADVSFSEACLSLKKEEQRQIMVSVR